MHFYVSCFILSADKTSTAVCMSSVCSKTDIHLVRFIKPCICMFLLCKSQLWTRVHMQKPELHMISHEWIQAHFGLD